MNPEGQLLAADQSAIQEYADTIDEGFGNITEFFVNLIFGTSVEVPLGAPFPDGSMLWDGPLLVLWAIVAAIGFTIYFKGVQFRGFIVGLEIVRGKWSHKDDPGEITHFQALTAAVSGTVGLGNIAGVAAAIGLGGPGATFWMILAGLLGMCTKFVECTLGVRYRTIDEQGIVHGGPFKYLPVAFRRLGRVPVAIITGIFAVSIMIFGVIGAGMFQANQAFSSLAGAGQELTGNENFLGDELQALIFGIVFAGLVGLVIIGGVKRIAAWTAKLVPIMAGVYVLACLIIIFANIGNIGDAFGSIITGAFSPGGIAGGVIGVIIIGVQRAAFSNEAGIGSAPIAHSAVKTRRPASEGLVATLEPFLDTVVVCTMTALVIIFAAPQSFMDRMDFIRLPEEEQAAVPSDEVPVGDITLTQDAFATFLPNFSVILAVAVFLFAFSTLITWSYYGIQAWRYLFGMSPATDVIFRLILCLMVIIGCLVSFGTIIDFADSALFLCIFINVIGLVILSPVVKKEVAQYLDDRKAGRLMEDPEYIPGPEDMKVVVDGAKAPSAGR